MIEVVKVLQADRELGYRVPEEQRERAELSSTARVIRVPVGRWDVGAHTDDARGGAGLLVLSGALVRRVGHHRNFGAELLAAGDILRPWQHDGEETGILPFETFWRVVAPVRVAVLDERWLGRMAPWPNIAGELIGRALERSLRLATLLAIAQQRRLDDRLRMLLWKLADRFGIVTPQGVELQLPLTHEVLAHLAAARRPSVSATIGRLTEEGHLIHDRRRWLLLGDPPMTVEDESAMSVP
jgi:CRP/FNR family transcriptional regulator, cyclic AMP receptor protein